jgi:hypothetical protein
MFEDRITTLDASGASKEEPRKRRGILART